MAGRISPKTLPESPPPPLLLLVPPIDLSEEPPFPWPFPLPLSPGSSGSSGSEGSSGSVESWQQLLILEKAELMGSLMILTMELILPVVMLIAASVLPLAVFLPVFRLAKLKLLTLA